MPHAPVTSPAAITRARVSICACWLICALAATAAAQSAAQCRFDARNTDHGLPNNFVYSVIQTRDGYLWFTTLDGLVRHDGVRFTVFNTSNVRNLPSNRLTDLFEDRAGALWIGTEGDGLVKYHRAMAEAIVVYTTKDGLQTNFIDAIYEDDGGDLLVTTGRGFRRLLNERFVPHAPDQPRMGKIFGYPGSGAPVWEIGQIGPNKFSDAVRLSYGALRIPQDTRVYSMSEDREGNLWIGASAGLIKLQNGSPRVYTEKDGIPIPGATFVKEDNQGNLWVGTAKGLRQFKDGKFIDAGLEGVMITGITEDREGALWISTWGSGLFRMNRQIVTAYTDKHGLAANNVYPIFEDRAGHVWMGTWDRGLTIYKDGRFSIFPGLRDRPGQLATALAEDDTGRLWIGSYGRVMSLKDGKMTDYAGHPPFLQLLANNASVQAILQDRAGSLWFGSIAGLLKYRDGQTTFYTTKDGLAGNDTHAILEDRQGRLWVGTYGGVTQIDGGEFISYTKSSGLSSSRVRSLYEDDAGAIWVGTYDGGLSRIKDRKIANITADDGLFNNGVFQILEDTQGNFWMTCNLGIYRTSKQQLNDFADGKIREVSSIVYGKSDGMLNPECNGGVQPAGVRARDGRLWFPTQHGVAVIDPETVPFNAQPPQVVQVIVIDNGKGFDIADRGRGFGLIGVAERARMLGGDLAIHSAPGQGATVRVTLILKEAPR